MKQIDAIPIDQTIIDNHQELFNDVKSYHTSKLYFILGDAKNLFIKGLNNENC